MEYAGITELMKRHREGGQVTEDEKKYHYQPIASVINDKKDISRTGIYIL